MRARNRQSGLTLVEAMIAAMVLGVTVVAVSQAIVAGQVQAHHARHAQRAMMLAAEAVAWVLAVPYHDPDGASTLGPDGGEVTPTDFDNGDDYHGLMQSGATLTDLAGRTYPDAFQSFTRQIECEYAEQTVQPLGVIAGLNVTVTITDGRGERWSLTRFIPAPAEPAH